MFPTDVWSCGEYSQSVNSFATGGNSIKVISNEYSTIGDSSIKITPSTQKLYWLDYESNNNFNEIGKTVTFAANICSNYNVYLKIYTFTTNYSSSDILIPANTPGNYSVTRSIDRNVTYILYRVEAIVYATDGYIYIDNLRLVIQ